MQSLSSLCRAKDQPGSLLFRTQKIERLRDPVTDFSRRNSLFPLFFLLIFISLSAPFSVSFKTSRVSRATASPQADKNYEAHNIHHTLYIHVVQFIPAIHFEVNIIIHSFCFTLNKCLFSAI